MPLAEPMTVATDVLLAAVASWLATRLLRDEGPAAGRLVRRLFAASFSVLAGVALLGAALHGLAPGLSLGVRETAWRTIYAGVGLANGLLVAGVALALVPRRHHPLLLGLLGLRFLGFLYLAFDRSFSFVLGDVAVSLLLLLGLGLFFVLVRPRPFGPWLLGASLVSFTGAIVQAWRLAPHPGFNHNDLFHVIQAGGVYLFHVTALRLVAEDTGSPNVSVTGLTGK